jgi:rubrerythrin
MKTLENLIKAYVGESQARNRYSFYVARLRKRASSRSQRSFC